MNPKESQLCHLRNATYGLINKITQKIENYSSSNSPIDAQSIYSLTKLIESYIKVIDAENKLDSRDTSEDNNKESVLDLLKIYEEKEMAPRAGFEPATKRLTAACSTTELPGI